MVVRSRAFRSWLQDPAELAQADNLQMWDFGIEELDEEGALADNAEK